MGLDYENCKDKIILINDFVKNMYVNDEYKKVVEVKSILDYTYRTSNFINLGVFKELVNESNN